MMRLVLDFRRFSTRSSLLDVVEEELCRRVTDKHMQEDPEDYYRATAEIVEYIRQQQVGGWKYVGSFAAYSEELDDILFGGHGKEK